MNEIKKVLVLDMDGTIADLYGVKDWLKDLRNENARPYIEAKPMYDMDILNDILLALKNYGWHIVVTSWLSKGSSKVYDDKVRAAKREWLAKHNFPYDEIHLVKYGTNKASCTRKYRYGGYQILVDDNEKIRQGWHYGKTIDARYNILNDLVELLEAEM
jgi:hypothetical protein